MLASLARAKNTALMLTDGLLRAVHVTSHVALRDVFKMLTKKKIMNTILLTHAGLVGLGIRRPRIAVCGLNPHAGDGGLFGNEEIRIIAPAVRACRAKGINVKGPLSADTVWPKVACGRYDAGVAMYHDQGQIAVKFQGFRISKKQTLSGGVNVTLGLPFVRTSPAHGTAYDIAGRGRASERSMIEATAAALAMAARR
jgi:4-hydroxythreonine-4-phosphate dehydrogenase